MPFKYKKAGKSYRSPSGRKFTKSPIRVYYASGGTFKYGKGKKPRKRKQQKRK